VVNVSIGDLIVVQNYNDLALEVNRLFSDNTVSLAWATSDLILNDVANASGESAGATRNLSPIPESDDFLVVMVDDVTLHESADYNINYTTGVITFVGELAGNAALKVYNRTTHRYGWGQQASVYPISEGDPILADEATLQAYLEANTNNLIDKVNIMEERTGGPSELTRVAQGNKIFATDVNTIQTAIDDDILTGTNYWNNVVATVSSSVESFTRTDPWDTKLVGVFRWTWDTYDDFRYFFNSGGEVRCNIEMTGDVADAGYLNWNQVVGQMGSLIVDYDTARQSGTGGISENLGAYELSTEYQTIYTSASPYAPYSGDGDYGEYGEYAEYSLYSDLVVLFEAKIVENAPAAGNISMDIRVTMDDSSFTNQDIAGTTTLNAGYKAADDITDNSAVFSIGNSIPAITAINDFTDDVQGDPGSGPEPEPESYTEIARFANAGYSDGDIITKNTSFDIDGGSMIMTVLVNELNGNVLDFSYDGDTTIYVATGENYNTTGSLRIRGTDSSNTSKTTFTFAPDTGVSASTEVTNLSFRISDIDDDGSRDERIVVNAYDSGSNPVPVTLTGGSNLTVSGNEASADPSNSSAANASNSLLIEVAGPVAQVEFVVWNDYGTTFDTGGTHTVWVSDVQYDWTPTT